jgi:hypothetical protein
MVEEIATNGTETIKVTVIEKEIEIVIVLARPPLPHIETKEIAMTVIVMIEIRIENTEAIKKGIETTIETATKIEIAMTEIRRDGGTKMNIVAAEKRDQDLQRRKKSSRNVENLKQAKVGANLLHLLL